MTAYRLRRTALVVLAASVISLTGCSTEYRGPDNRIDGVLWRQIAAFEDPLARDLFRSPGTDAADYLEAIDGLRWEGSTASASHLDLRTGGVVIYDLASTDSNAAYTPYREIPQERYEELITACPQPQL